MATFGDLINDKTQASWFGDLRTRLKDTYQVPVETWLSVVNTGLALSQYVAEGLAKIGAQVSGILRALFLETSSGAGLTLFGASQYQLPRTISSTTFGQVLLTAVAGAGPYTIAPGDLTVGTPGSGGKLYTNTTGGVLTGPGTLTITVQAIEPGVSSNVPVGSIGVMKTPLAGVTVSNPAVGASGTWITSPGTDGEPETTQGDAAYKRRLLLRWAVAGELVTNPATGDITVVVASCTQDAYEFWARYPVNGGKSSPVSKAKILSNWANGAPLAQAVTVLVAGPAGALGAADIAAVALNFEAPRKYPLHDRLFVATVVPVTVTLTGTVYVTAPYSLADVESQVAAALAQLQADIQIGATVYRTELIGTVQKANDAAIRNVDLTAPAGDTAVAFNGLVTVQSALTYVQV